MDLVPYIYHELQEKNGSMLCAQHALNNLLQQRIYSEVDLADIAMELDRKENSALDEASQRKDSQNMDDTGYFSLSVLENSLQVWGLTLVRWRSEEMRPYHDHPELQPAFILNLQNHWLPIRRFSSPNRWYNLNSFLDAPQWISPTFLAMVLTQAEEEGYNVFVVRPLDSTALGDAENGTTSALPESQADLLALELGEPDGRSGGGVSNISTANSSTYASVAASSSTAAANRQSRSQSPTTSASPADPVAASLARSRAALDAFTREQEAALRHGGGSRPGRRRRQEDVPTMFDDEQQEEGPLRASSGIPDDSPPPMNRFQQQRAEEEEMMRQAIEASLAEARDRGERVDEVSQPLPQVTAPQVNLPHDADLPDSDMNQDEQGPDYDLLADQRHYDDEDAALQAALSASLAETGVEGLILPAERPIRRTSSVQGPATSTMEQVTEGATKAAAPEAEVVEEVKDEDEDEPVVEELSPEELRRKRLERFK